MMKIKHTKKNPNFVFDKFLHKRYLIGVYEKIEKERGIACSHGDADNLLKLNVHSEHHKYVIDYNIR
jgi:hypothetical protein